MDPKACLDCVERALSQGDVEAAEEALDDYRYWRRNGGFDPGGQDERCAQLATRVQEHRQP